METQNYLFKCDCHIPLCLFFLKQSLFYIPTTTYVMPLLTDLYFSNGKKFPTPKPEIFWLTSFALEGAKKSMQIQQGSWKGNHCVFFFSCFSFI